MQHLGGKIARPAVLAVGGKAGDEGVEPLIGGTEIGPAVQAALTKRPRMAAKPLRPSQAPMRRRTGVMKAARS